jgi:hypothetical protein
MTQEDKVLSQELQSELERLYRIPSGRSILEKAQEKALFMLDSYEKRKSKKSPNVPLVR